jgi:hypothetical protein
MLEAPFRAALGGGVFIFNPPPPPPPPGPGVVRNTRRTGSGSFNGSVGVVLAPALRLAASRMVAATTPCRLVDTASGIDDGRDD